MRKLCEYIVLGACMAVQAARADFPERPIRIIVPFPPGGTADALARTYSERLSAALGQPVVVDNRGGADTQIGSALLSKAPADGYTLGLLTSALAINDSLYPKLPYGALRSFTPIAGVAVAPMYLVACPSVEAKSAAELFKLAKLEPGKLSYATSSGDGYLIGARVNNAAKIDTMHVRYKGTAPAMLAVMSCEVTYSFFTLLGIKSQVDDGKLKVLGVTSPKPMPQMPAVPTLGSEGLRGFDAGVWFGIFGPPNLPVEVVTKLNTESRKILADRQMLKAIDVMGGAVIDLGAQAFFNMVAEDVNKYARTVKENNLHPD